ncbi:MAG TPA: hypothetical protein PLR88_06030 [Bacteroidales bacterium]|nr:hypothetical protein [Bacteroidales bacterium]
MRTLYLFVFLMIISTAGAQAQNRWNIEPDGSISWTVKNGDVHTDNIEMSGRFVSLIATYGVDEKNRLVSEKKLVFPMLRTIPNNTHASLIYTFGTEVSPIIKINNQQVKETITRFSLRGILTTESKADGIDFKRELFPSVNKPLVVEKYTVTNNSGNDITIEIEDFEKITRTQPEKSVYGVYEIVAKSAGAGLFTLKNGENLFFSVQFSGRKISDNPLEADAEDELKNRTEFIGQMFANLTFRSPDPVLNRMFDFAKIRAMESIFETKRGLVHSPGGASYYAAIWANDQAEYANPFFAYTGYPTAVEAGKVSWNWFAGYMNKEYKPIPSSIIAEGTDFWDGAGDRGDQAMIAYGASRFALALGDRKTAEELWPLIEWCIEYSKRKINSNGVVMSDSDELEGRFPAGDANLCTSSLLYDALQSAACLGKDLGKPEKQTRQYMNMAHELRTNIEKYFGADIDGFKTYRYYDGNDVLRSWICIPLTVGIFERAKGTADALFSPELWTDQGLLTQAGTSTFWDRSTLYALRGVIAAGEVDRALKYLAGYSNRRLLGEHVPYAVEAWPEGSQRHLSAESALYCRVITEGIFGFRPTGLNSFTITPQLPAVWNEMSLLNINAFDGRKIDINITREINKIKVIVISDGKQIKNVRVLNGSKVEINLSQIKNISK